MRINVYSQELLCEPIAPGTTQAHAGGALLIPELLGGRVIEPVMQQADTGVHYSAVRMFLKSAQELHDHDGDDDRSAITFWLPKSEERREAFAQTLEALAALVRLAAPETGLD